LPVWYNTANMVKPPIVDIINNSPEPLPKEVMEIVKAMRLKIEERFPRRKFKFVLNKLEDDKWDIQVHFEKPLGPKKPKTI